VRNERPLTNEQLAEWVANELPKYEEIDRGGRRQSRAADPPISPDFKQLGRTNAIIAGQQVILRNLPGVELTGDFRVAPTADGGWKVRFAVRGAETLVAAASGYIECVVDVDGTVVLPNESA